MNSKESIERALFIFEAYLEEPDPVPEEIADEFRTWLLDPERTVEKSTALRQLWDERVSPAGQPGESALRSFEVLARRLDLPESTDPDYKTFDRSISRIGSPEPLRVLPDCAVPPSRPAASRMMPMRAAAIVVPLLVLAGVLWSTLRPPEPAAEFEPIERITQIRRAVPDSVDQQGRADLADGSALLIAPGTAICYPGEFAGQRHVALQGEAYFSVEKDSLHPFTVETEYLNIRVLGTQFDVEAHPGSRYTTVTLYAGRVQAESTRSACPVPVTLLPGSRLVYENETGRYTIEQTDDTLPAWIAQRLTFNDTTAGKVLEIIEWYYGVTVETQGTLDEEALLTYRYTGAESLATALQLLQEISAYSIDFAVEGDTVKVRSTIN